MKAITLRREELYTAIWRGSLHAVAAAYDVSDPALRKICKKLVVPIPPRGHQAKVAAGKRVRIPPLPKLKPGGASEHRLARYGVRSRTFRTEGSTEPKIIVPDALNRPHPLIRSSLALLRQSAKTENRHVTSTGSCLDIAVGKQCLDRALRIMDTLLKALEERSHIVEVTTPKKSAYNSSPPSPSVTRVLVDGEWIKFRIDERREQVPNTVPRDAPLSLRPGVRYTGRLTLRITNALFSGLRQSWSDGRKQRPEDCLGDFVASLAAISAALKAERAESERQAQERAEARRQKEEYEKRKEIERRLRYDVTARAADWAEAQRLGVFLSLIEEELASCLDSDADSLAIKRQWLAWAKEYASRLMTGALKLVEFRTPPAQERVQPWNAQWQQVTSADIAGYLSTYLMDKAMAT
jgi:hypothetical protein